MIKIFHRAFSLLQHRSSFSNVSKGMEMNSGQLINVNGWVKSVRPASTDCIFITLTDWSENLQLLVSKDHFQGNIADIQRISIESVISAKGVLKTRPASALRTTEVNGNVELEVVELELLNAADPLPLIFKDNILPEEEKRLEYRYLDLRRKEMQRNIRFRSAVVHEIRQKMQSLDFVDIETPLLFKSTPEGAAEFIVDAGNGFQYALPQSPQQFKQLLVIGGFEKYYQIAKCFRNESLRSDRQPEFTQFDIEMGFAGENDVKNVVEIVIREIWTKFLGIMPQFKKMTYDEALCLYGSDKPDLRTNLCLKFESIDGQNIQETLSIPKNLIDKQIIRQFSESDVEGTINRSFVEQGDIVIFRTSRTLKAHVGYTLLGRVRQSCIQKLNFEPDLNTFLWVNEFPLFYDSNGKLNSMHHPFTAPIANQRHLLESEPLSVRAHHYDLVLNGVEIGGGSARIHEASFQEEILGKYLQLPHDKIALFKHLLDALKYGAPPHAGFALGLDRLIAVMRGSKSIRDVIAFPKNSSGHDPLFRAPTKQ